MKNVLSLLIILNALFTFSCAQKPDSDKAGSEAQVLIPWYNTETKRYEMTPVTLGGLTNLSEMQGAFVNFIISPTKKNGRIAGDRPRASFFKSKNGYFVARDGLSLQLATIYSTLENLAKLDEKVGAIGVNQWPRDVGVSVMLKDAKGSVTTNNAFFDGGSDSILFVNYTLDGLEIPLNTGVIAHEHFHSLFYKVIFKQIEKKISIEITTPHLIENEKMAVDAKITDEPKKEEAKDPKKEEAAKEAEAKAKEAEAKLKEAEAKAKREELERKAEAREQLRKQAHEFMKIYLVGLNEGLADYWAWLYTGNSEFVSLSLPRAGTSRTLDFNHQRLVKSFFTKSDITLRFQNMNRSSMDPDNDKLGLSYQLGTQYARMLKLITEKIVSERSISLKDAKLIVAKAVFKLLFALKEQSLKEQAQIESEEETPNTLVPQAVLKTIAESIEGLQFNECKMISEYINAVEPVKKDWKCVQSGDPKQPTLKLVKP